MIKFESVIQFENDMNEILEYHLILIDYLHNILL
jgi:hypothetical protein